MKLSKFTSTYRHTPSTLFFLLLGGIAAFTIHQTPQAYASYRECTNSGSACANVCGTGKYADVTVNANGSYTCGCAGSCTGTAGQSCGNNASATCKTANSGSCSKGGVCGALWCCSGSAVGSTPVNKSGTTGGSSSSASSSSSSSSSSSNNGTTANSTTSICSSIPGSTVGTWTCDNTTGTSGNLHLCKGSTDAQTLSCNGKGCHQYGNSSAQDDTCNDQGKVTVNVPYTAATPYSGGSTGNFITCDHPDDQTNGNNGYTISGGNHSFCAAYQYCSGSSYGAGVCTPKSCEYQFGQGNNGLCASSNSSCPAGYDINTCTSGKCCAKGSATLLVLGTSAQAGKPVDTTLNVQMNAYAAQTGTNLLAQATNMHGSQVLAATTYTSTDKVNLDTNTTTSASYSNKNFNLSNIPTGKYKVYMHIDRYLNTKVVDEGGNDSFTFPLNPTLVTKILKPIPGDAAPLPHGDNYIDIQDYNYVLECQGLKTTQKSTACPDAAMADMDENGIINADDLQRVRDHFGESGDSPFPPQFTCVTDPSCVSGNNTIQACALKCSITTPNQ